MVIIYELTLLKTNAFMSQLYRKYKYYKTLRYESINRKENCN